jgi:hypothetical protein
MQCPSPVIFEFLSARAPEGGATQTDESGRQGEIPPNPAQSPSRKADNALLSLTCKDIEEIIYAKFNWPR